MPARDALHLLMVMKDDLAPGGAMEASLDTFEQSQRGMIEPGSVPAEIEAVPAPYGRFAPEVPYEPLGLAKAWRTQIEQALAYYVDPKMTALVTAAAEDMPDNPLRPDDLPSTHGFLHLPSGMTEVDLRGQLMVHNAIFWVQYGGGVDLWFMSNKFDERDTLNQKHRRMFGEETFNQFPMLMPALYTRLTFGAPFPLQAGGNKVLPPEISDHLKITPGPDGQLAWFWPEGYDMNEWLEDMNNVHPAGAVLWVVAMWRLMQQTITDVRTEPVDRTLRKGARRRNMRRDDVTVITLRKRKRVPGEGPEQEIEWSHRWLRRGHWRQQWVGPLNGGPDERYQTPVWIHSTICGPEDKPLLIRDHVYSLER